MSDLLADSRVVRFLRRQDEAREVLEGVRGLALELNAAIERATELGLDVAVKLVPRKNLTTGTHFSQIIPSLFIGREIQ